MSAASTPGKMVHRALMGTILVGYRDESIFHCGIGLRHHSALDEQEQNARRLVAAWNATEGVPIEVLEANTAGGLPWQFMDQLELRADRDRLLAALKAILTEAEELRAAYSEMRESDGYEPVEADDCVAEARSAIAKSKAVA